MDLSSQALAYCRPGFEKDLAAEMLQICAKAGLACLEHTRPDCGYVLLDIDAPLEEASAQLTYQRLVFARQLIWVRQVLADLPDRDPRNGLTDAWRVVPDDRLVTFEPGGLPKSWRISAVRRNAADLSLVVNDPVTGEPVEPDLMALLRDGCFDFDRSRETPEWQGFWRSERGTVAYRDASGLVRRWTPGMMKPTHGKGNAN